MLITFSGLDGSGKSTIAECLRESLEKRDKRVAVFHMYYDIGLLACARAVLKRIGGRRDDKQTVPETKRAHAPREGKSKGARLKSALAWNKSLRLCVYPLDLVIFLCYRLYIEKVKGRVLIMDRYFYDTLVDVSDGRRRRRGVRLLSRLTPQPTVPVLVDISPEEAFARKGEHSVDYLSRRRRSYQELFPKNGGAVVLAGGDDLTATRTRLEQIVLERMTA
jgi:thymidylate kinase